MYMGEPLPTQITLPLEPNEDAELTCFVCKSKATCQLCIRVHYPGCTLWYGIHADCVAIAERGNCLSKAAAARRPEFEEPPPLTPEDSRRLTEEGKELKRQLHENLKK